ncbi:MAG: hypothetical protein COB12_07595 [Flavobacterium sp.]|nr:MAG: hypothetical protein COB12_07595 [Flavobacterium sp.]
MKKHFLIVFISAILISCSSSDDSTTTTPDDDNGNIPLNTLTLLKIELTNYINGNATINTLTYSYNSDNKLAQAVSENENGIFTTNYIYSGNDITLLEYSNGQSRDFIYESGIITSSTHFLSNSTRTYQYEYNSSQQMIKEEEYVGQDLLCTKSFQYGTNDNVIYAELPCNNSNIEYEYDTKKNPNSLLYPENYLKIFLNGKNNVNEFTTEYSAGGNTTIFITTVTLEYNSDNYPTKKMYYNEAGELLNMEEYFYE